MTDFVNFAFSAAYGSATRTMPDRLADVANVKDFGATGDGSTDDWAAITAAYNHGSVTLTATGPSVSSVIPFASVPATITTLMFAKNLTNPSAFAAPAVTRVGSVPPTSPANTVTLGFIPDGAVQTGDRIQFTLSNKGTIVFPPGTYKVSQSVLMDGAGFRLVGCGSASTITGNFSGFIIKRDETDGDQSQFGVVDNLTVTNTHASGGGIQYGQGSLGGVLNCTVVANQGIQLSTDRTPTPAGGPFDMSIENCNVSPGANVSGSIGIMSLANGPIYNCKIVGYESGMRVWGNEGYYNILGCYFEGNVIGLDLGVSPDGTSSGSGGLVASGCWFKDNGTAIKFGDPGAGGGRLCGIRIEASESITVGGSRPQYGIYISDVKCGFSLFAGITVTGQYDQYGIYDAGDDPSNRNLWTGVQSVNTSTHGGLAWHLPVTPAHLTGMFVGCNVAPVCTVSALPASPFEGDCYNVSDSNSSTWGATPAGSGSTHAKLRYNGSAWTVVGK